MNWTKLAADQVKAGDIVSADAGGMPIYRVVEVADGQAVLEGDRGSSVRMPINRFHWKAQTA